MAGLDESLRDVLGGKAAKKLDEAFGLRTTGDLLRHYPRRYAQRGELTDLAALRDGEHVTVFAQVAKVSSRRMRQRRGQVLEVTVTDGRARLVLTFFNRVQMFERQLTPGRHGMFAGRVSTFKGQRQLAHPEFKLLGADDRAHLTLARGQRKREPGVEGAGEPAGARRARAGGQRRGGPAAPDAASSSASRRAAAPCEPVSSATRVAWSAPSSRPACPNGPSSSVIDR